LSGDHAGRLPAYRPIGANCHHGTVFDGPIDAVLAITSPNRRRRKRPAKLHADRPYDILAAVEGSPGAARVISSS